MFFAGFQFFGATAIVGEGILLTPSETNAEVGETVTLTANVQDDARDPVSGRAVTFEIVSGPNAGVTDTDVTDPLGRAFFSYTSAVNGSDVVQATFTDSNGDPTSNQVQVIWGEDSPTPIVTVEYLSSSTPDPMRGEYLEFSARVTNTTADNVPGNLFADCLNPTGTRLYRRRMISGTLRPFQSAVVEDRVLVPSNAPSGTYLCTLSAENPDGL